MNQERVKVSSVIKNQLPEFIRVEFPLISQFLTRYYNSIDGQSLPQDLLENVDQYVKLDVLANIPEYVNLTSEVTLFDTEIFVDNTSGFPEKNGLIKIGDEIILYGEKTNNSFKSCSRGFSGISKSEQSEELIFNSTNASQHINESKVENISGLSLRIFLEKLKSQISPGFEYESFVDDLNKNIFLTRSIDFYRSKGSDESFKILFRALYGKDVKIIKPYENTIEPSTAKYRVSQNLIIEIVSGDVDDLKNRTIFQDEDTENGFTFAQGSVSDVQVLSQGDDTYYLLKVDSDYDKDITVTEGTVVGSFSTHAKTSLLESALANSTILNVESTLGFPDSGSIVYRFPGSQVDYVIKYTSKSYNQFLGCSGISIDIPENAELRINAYSYAYAGSSDQQVRFRVSSIAGGIEPVVTDYYYREGDKIEIETLGKSDTLDIRNSELVYNLPLRYDILSVGSESGLFKITTKKPNNFLIDEKIILRFRNLLEKEYNVVDIQDKSTFLIPFDASVSSFISSDLLYVKRNLQKLDATNYPNTSDNLTNIQNTYYDSENNLYIAASSLPNYRVNSINPEIEFSGVFSSAYLTILNHKLFTGDFIRYIPGEGNNKLNINAGLYYVSRVSDDLIQLASSKPNLFNANYINVTSINSSYTNSSGTVVQGEVFKNKFVLEKYSNDTLSSAKVVKKISKPNTTDKKHPIEDYDTIGILNNGVEISNNISKDSIFYGEIDRLIVTNGGSNYDVMNPPKLFISDSVGVGATAELEVNGSLSRIDIIDPGFDFYSEPEVVITGGNGKDAQAEARLSVVENILSFNSADPNRVNLVDNTIGFSTFHRFRDYEQVIYDPTLDQPPIVGLQTGSQYYVELVSDFAIKLYSSLDDISAGINTVNLTDYGKGIHRIKSLRNKNKLESIVITNSGYDYGYKKVYIKSDSVDIHDNVINLNNHGYKTGDIIVYKQIDNWDRIFGLVSGNNYYVSVVNENTFRLAGISTVGGDDFNLRTNQFIDFIYVQGGSVHEFNYPDIKVEITGISSITRRPVLQPIFKGSVVSAFLNTKGTRYGSDRIINYDRQPIIEIDTGSKADLEPIVVDGKIEAVLIKNGGQNYFSVPELIVNGSGTGAKLVPVLSNGKISRVSIFAKGIKYEENKTTITVVPAGIGAKVEAKIQEWKINEVQKLISYGLITSDDGFIRDGKYGIQYTHLYAPREFRKTIFGKKYVGGQLSLDKDLILDQSGNEEESDRHSPIIGWAYDGNPIYGPYGFTNADGSGGVKCLESGYSSVPVYDSNRPSGYDGGFFIKDFYFSNAGDLDENNGRFCVTPEYPNGVYAYFTTIDPNTYDTDPSSPFRRFRRPVYPYVIGNSFKSSPIEFNFSDMDQETFDPIKYGLLRNTTNYEFTTDNVEYPYVNDPLKNSNQTGVINFSTKGGISGIEIVDPGNNYQVDDRILLSLEDDGEVRESLKISEIVGKDVDNILYNSYVETDIEVIQLNSSKYVGVCSTPHEFSNLDSVKFTGFSTSITSQFTDEFFDININPGRYFLKSKVGTVIETGPYTYIRLSGDISYPNLLVNDLLLINNEKVRVLDIHEDYIRIERQLDGTIGLAHSSTSLVTSIDRKFEFNLDIDSKIESRLDTVIYFDPQTTVSVGASHGPGIGNLLPIPNVSYGSTQVFVDTRTIYYRNHKLQTGDKIFYSSNGGDPIKISLDGLSSFDLVENQELYAVRLTEDTLGISTQKLRLDVSEYKLVGYANTTIPTNTLVYFTFAGTQNNHKLTTQYDNVLRINSERNRIVVSTAQTHGLSIGDRVDIKVNSGLTTNYKISYDDNNRRLLVNAVNFSGSSINVARNTITIPNHNFNTGDKVVYKSVLPITDLQPGDNRIVFIIKHSDDEIKFVETYYESTKDNPTIVPLVDQEDGYLAKVNPEIVIYKNTDITFDLSDTSLSSKYFGTNIPAFDFKLFNDDNFHSEFFTTGESNKFNVVYQGIVGISSDAKVKFTVTDEVPDRLYYSLVPVNEDLLPPEKKEYINDFNLISNNNSISIRPSLYNNNYNVVGISTYSFECPANLKLESEYYSSVDNEIEYSTTSKSAYGPIKTILLNSYNRLYSKEPVIKSIKTSHGYGSFLNLITKDIGKPEGIDIRNINFEYSSDITLRPTCIFPQLLKVQPRYKIGSIDINSKGLGYVTKHDIIVVDDYNNLPTNKIKMVYDPINENIEILSNEQSLIGKNPKVFTINNSTGVGISSAVYSKVTQKVTLQLDKAYSDANNFPFSIGDEILVENIVHNDGFGFNSSDYNYTFFPITDIDANIGGFLPTISYSLSNYLDIFSTAGEFVRQLSFGRVVKKEDLPEFDISLDYISFNTGEEIISGDYRGNVLDWNYENRSLKISSSTVFPKSGELKGTSSGNVSTIISNTFTKSNFIISPYAVSIDRWVDQKGFLNDSTQRIHDNDYYQKFSYSLNSDISYNEWGDAIGALVHPAGFKEFSELQMETSPTVVSGNCELVSGICTSQDNGEFIGISELVSEINLDCYPSFDIVKEVTQNISGRSVSNKIVFNSRILNDYFESIGNRVVEIQIPDDRTTVVGGNVRTVLLDQFNVGEKRYKKYLTYSQFSEDSTKKQISLLSAAFEGNNAYLNEYARISTDEKYSGNYDFDIEDNLTTLKFIPDNDVLLDPNEFFNTVLSFDINNNVGVNTITLGDVASFSGNYALGLSGSNSQTVISIAKSEFRSAKAVVAISSDTNNFIQINELTFLADNYIGSTPLDLTEINIVDYGKIVSDDTIGLGTYYAYVQGDYVNVDFISNSSLPFDCDFNSSLIRINDHNSVSVGSTFLNTGKVSSFYKEIPIGSISENPIVSFSNNYQFGAYLFVIIENKSTNQHQATELVVLSDPENSDTSISEFGTVSIDDYRHGYFTVSISGEETVVNFVPSFGTSNIEIRGYMQSIGLSNPNYSDLVEVDLGNTSLRGSNTFFGGYSITLNRSFEMFNNRYPIFKRSFDGSDNNIVSIGSSTIKIFGNNFVTGERLRYTYGEGNVPIKIQSTNIPGIGVTDILPEEVYAVRVNTSQLSLSATPEDALSSLPQVLSFSEVGIGNSHYLQSHKQIEKCLVTIDNLIQSPISISPIKTTLSSGISSTTSFITLSGIGSIYTGDLVKVDNEFMLIDDVGVPGSPNICRVRRDWMNTVVEPHSSGSEVRKYTGNYNVHENFMTFVGDPINLTPQETEKPDEIDFTGIQTSSNFYGRAFFRSGVVGSANTTYRENYVFDDISSQFKNRSDNLLIKTNEYNVHDIEDMNAVVLVKDIFQIPKRDGNPRIDGSYYIGGTGISTIFFVQSETGQDYDINTFNIPVGGVIQQVSSNNATGYQPLSGAGGTAVYNLSNDLVSISIGSSGSGYRQFQQNQGVQVRIVGISSDDYQSSLNEVVGFANIADGHVYGVTITNPINISNEIYEPKVVIDEPQTYDNIPLIYSSSSPINGIGTESTADIVVSNDGTIESFKIKNYGYSYDNLEILTIPTDGDYGIPLDSSKSLNEFQITLDKVYTDKFSGWSMGEFAPLDYIDNMFDGQRSTFPISINGEVYPIISRKGSRIDLKMTLLVFVNNILQRPDVGYKFEGGSFITFAEPPKRGDKCEIIFYKGTPGVDVIFNDIIETIEPGDNVTIDSDDFYYQEDERFVEEIESIDTIITSPYSGVGISDDFDLERPLTWCKQRNDIKLGNEFFTKDRVSLETQVYPTCNVINSVGVGSTHIFVDTLLPFFSSEKENAVDEKRRTVEIISKFEGQRAQLQASLDSEGYINAITIIDGGSGYSYPPIISVETNIGTASSEIPVLLATVNDTTGSIINVSIAQSGAPFITSPTIIVNKPDLKFETLDDVEYFGDYGNIVGIGTTTIPGATLGLKFQLEIPGDSILRDRSISGFAATTSRLEKDYYFRVSNSNVGSGLNSLDRDGNLLFQSSSFIDNIYKVITSEVGDNIVSTSQVISVNTEVASATMIDTSGVIEVSDGIEFTIGAYSNLDVIVSVNDYGSILSDLSSAPDPYYFGSFSWGRIIATDRKLKNYTFGFPNNMNNVSDLPTVRRKAFLNFKFYNK